jgi:sec-independent protein translocase protein TatC
MRLLPRRLRHGEEATLVEHLGELRARIVVSLLSIAIALGAVYPFRAHLIHWLLRPVNDRLKSGKLQFVTLSPAEPFITSFMVSFYAAMLICVPILLWQVWSFLAPAFQHRTQRIVASFTAFAGFLLISGVTFGYFVALPAAVKFLTDYDADIYHIQLRAREYLSFAALVLAACALVFLIPIFILCLVRLGVLSTARLKKNRRLGYVIMAALAVALPGIDPVTTTVEMIPLMLLFEGTIHLSSWFDKRWKKRQEQREREEAGAFDHDALGTSAG